MDLGPTLPTAILTRRPGPSQPTPAQNPYDILKMRFIMINTVEHPVILHFKDGTFQTGLLQSHLLTGKNICYVPQSLIMDRRQDHRVPFIKEVTIHGLGVRRTVDLSPDGMYVETLIPYSIGAVLPITLRLGHGLSLIHI